MSFRWNSDDCGVLGDGLVVFLVYGGLVPGDVPMGYMTEV